MESILRPGFFLLTVAHRSFGAERDPVSTKSHKERFWRDSPVVNGWDAGSPKRWDR